MAQPSGVIYWLPVMPDGQTVRSGLSHRWILPHERCLLTIRIGEMSWQTRLRIACHSTSLQHIGIVEWKLLSTSVRLQGIKAAAHIGLWARPPWLRTVTQILGSPLHNWNRSQRVAGASTNEGPEAWITVLCQVVSSKVLNIHITALKRGRYNSKPLGPPAACKQVLLGPLLLKLCSTVAGEEIDYCVTQIRIFCWIPWAVEEVECATHARTQIFQE